MPRREYAEKVFFLGGTDFKMNLNSTEKLIDKMIKEKDFDFYAVLVSKNGQRYRKRKSDMLSCKR